MYGSVQVASTSPATTNVSKIRLYYPVKVFDGPDATIVNDYNTFVRYYGEDELAQFLFERGYQLFCNKVSHIEGYANCTKYSDGTYLQDTNRYVEAKLVDDRPDSTYTYHLKFNSDYEDYNNFYLLVRKGVEDLTGLITDSYNTYNVGLFGYEYVRNQGDDDWNLGLTNIENMFKLNPVDYSIFLRNLVMNGTMASVKNYTIDEIEETFVDFLRENCTLEVIDMGHHHYLVSSNSPNLQIYCNCDLITVVDRSEDFYYRVKSYWAQNDRVLSISTKYYCGESNITVTIAQGNFGKYSVRVVKDTGEYINEEYFEVKLSELEEIQSDYVEFTLYDESGDITGTYELIGCPCYYEDGSFEDVLSDLNVEENDYPQVDIFVDTADSSLIPLLATSIYPNAVILSNNITGTSILSITPRYVTWLTNGLELPSGYIILDLIPSETATITKEVFRPIWDDSDNTNVITEEEYDYILTNLHVLINNSPYSVKCAVARAMIYRFLTEVHGRTQDLVKNNIDTAMSDISNLMDMDITYDIVNEGLYKGGTVYKCTIRVSLDNQIFENYNIAIEVEYNGSV